MFVEGHIDEVKLARMIEATEAELARVYLPKFDDAVAAREMMNDVSALWGVSSTGRRNRLLRSLLDAIFVDLEDRLVIGVSPKGSFREMVAKWLRPTKVSLVDQEHRQ